jgi:DNA-binding NtrC family response regulator
MKPLLILVLDGDPERRRSWVALLSGPDHQVTIATDPNHAGELIETGRAEALVLDLSLPSVDRSALRQAMTNRDSEALFSLEEAERAHLARVLRHTDGNKRRAAHLLGIARSTLLNKVRKYGLES